MLCELCKGAIATEKHLNVITCSLHGTFITHARCLVESHGSIERCPILVPAPHSSTDKVKCAKRFISRHYENSSFEDAIKHTVELKRLKKVELINKKLQEEVTKLKRVLIKAQNKHTKKLAAVYRLRLRQEASIDSESEREENNLGEAAQPERANIEVLEDVIQLGQEENKVFGEAVELVIVINDDSD